MLRPTFDSRRAYGQKFTDAEFWLPYVEYVWRTDHLGSVESCVAGLPGTNPVFIVNTTYVIKFFTDLFGHHSDQVERAFYTDVQPHLNVPTPSLVCFGSLYEVNSEAGWHWPYIVTTLMPGVSVGEMESPTPVMHTEAAKFAARVHRAFHDCVLPSSGVLKANWDAFGSLLHHRRIEIPKTIHQLPVPAELRRSLLNRLEDMPRLFDPMAAPKLLHGDLNRDHILCQSPADGTFEFTGVIDFGDVKVGDPLYDLVPLHFGLFDGDKSLLRIYLDAYGSLSLDDDFADRALNYTLFYESDVLSDWFEKHREAGKLTSVRALRDELWGL